MLQLELAATKLPILKLLEQLRQAGCQIPTEMLLPDRLKAHIEQQQGRQDRIRNLWKTAQLQQLSDLPEALHACRQLKITLDAGVQWQRVGLQQFVGHISKAWLTSELIELGAKRIKLKSNSALLLPCYDLPQRICGFMALDGELQTSEYAGLNPSIANGLSDAGLAFHPRLLSSHAKVIFGFSDPILATYMQARAFVLQQDPLPIVVWRHGQKSASTHSWQMLMGRKVILWTVELTAELIAQAHHTNCLLSDVGPADPTTQHTYFQGISPQDFLTHLAARARPWTEVIGKQVLKQSLAQLDYLISRLNLIQAPLGEIIQALPYEAQQRMVAATKQTTGLRTVQFDQYQVEERETGWHAVRVKQQEELLVSSALLRIDEVIHQPRSGQTYYRGRILYKGHEVEFCEPKKVVERGTLEWMQQLLINRQLGLLVYTPSWSKRVVQLAVQFNEPKMSQGTESIGWDPAESCYVLPSFKIMAGGQIKPVSASNFLVNPPAVSMLPPEPVAPTDVDCLLQGTSANDFYWALWCAWVAAIVAPATGHRKLGVAIVGRQAEVSAKSVATDCGVLTVAYPAATKPDKVLDEAMAHSWPQLLSFSAFLERNKPAFLSTNGSTVCSVGVNPEQGLALLVHGEWQIINYRDCNLSTDEHDSLKLLLPAYLQDLSARRHQLVGERQEDLTQWIVEDVAAWLKRLGCDGDNVLRAKEWLSSADDKCVVEVFSDTIYRATVNKLAQVVSQHDHKCRQPIWMVDQGVFLPHRVFRNILLKQKAAWLDFNRLTEQLLVSGVLAGDTEFKGEPGWLLNGDWFYKSLKQRQAVKSPVLRIVS